MKNPTKIILWIVVGIYVAGGIAAAAMSTIGGGSIKWFNVLLWPANFFKNKTAQL